MTLAIDRRIAHGERIVNGVRLHYVEAGPEDGPLVCLLHGFPDHWYGWRRQLPALADAGFRVVAPDMRGYNRSEKPHGVDAYRLERLSTDVAELIEAIGGGGGTGHVVGHDWGGVVAWDVARRFPESVDRLAILNAPHPAEFARELSLEQVARSWYALWFQVPRLPERLLSARDYGAIERVYREGTAGAGEGFTDADVIRLRSAMERPGALTSALNYYRAFARTDVRHELAGALPLVGSRLTDPVEPIDAPTLVLWGERDAALSVERSEGLDQYARDVRVERFPNAAHWPHVELPGRVNDDLRAFLAA